MGTKVSQLLTVWNPYYEPQTIQAHVEILRRREKVWWARLYLGKAMDEATARQRFKDLVPVVEEAQRSRRDLVLFVTNYVYLHALRVERVVFGEALDPAEAPYIPAYYAKQRARPALWFLVRDIRPLAFNHLDTLRYFLERGELEAGLNGSYDPYAAYFHWYPIVVRGPTAESIFDPRLLRGKARRFADHREALYPPEIELARRELEGVFGPLWAKLEEKSRTFLATSWVVYERYQAAHGFDLSAAFSGVSRAVETELCEGLVDELDALTGGAARRAVGASPMTLGRAARAFDDLAALAGRYNLPRLATLAADPAWRRWLRNFVHLRNDASHVNQVRPERFRRAWSQVVAHAENSRLTPLIEAKEEVRASLLPPA